MKSNVNKMKKVTVSEETHSAYLCIRLDKKGHSDISIFGNEYTVLNLLACAMDVKNIRALFYTAIELDKRHDEKIGRRYDYNLPE